MYTLAQQMLAQGAPLHGIGFESHFLLNGFSQTLVQNFARFEALGIEFALTELDIRFTLPSSATLLSQQALLTRTSSTRASSSKTVSASARGILGEPFGCWRQSYF